jgi:flagellar biosynthesis/type III secretory pathway chaperone
LIAALDARMQTEYLESLIGQKLAILEQMHELSRAQQEYVAKGEITHLLQILAAKQGLIVDLRATENRLDPYREQDPEARIWRSAEARENCRQASQRCDQLLSEIMRLEKQCEDALQQRRDSCAERLRDLQSGVAAHAAYHDSQPQSSSTFDLTAG